MYPHTMICQVFVLCLSWHIVDHSGLKISVHGVLTLDTEIKRNPLVQDPGCMGGGGCFKSSKSSKPMSSMVDCAVQGHCPGEILRNLD